MSQDVLLTLGEYQFSMNTAAHNELERTDAYRWVSQKRLGREPALQFIGKGEAKISLKGTIYPHFRGGLGQIFKLRDSAEKGDPLTLVDGRGNNLGQWCIKTVKETEKSYIGPGLPRRIDFSLELEAYGPDGDSLGGGGNDGGVFNWLSLLA